MRTKTALAARKITLGAMLAAAAMLLSYVEALVPPVIPIPGVKLGLANLASLFALYTLGAPAAIAVSAVRVSLSALLFGSVASFAYAAAGAALSLCIMILLKRSGSLALPTVSIAGAMAHNVAQIGVALLILQTEVVIYYLPALMISGIISGAVIGAVGYIMVKKLSSVLSLDGREDK